MPLGKIWLKLQHTNNWIYVLERNTMIDVNCENKIETVELEGSGILEMDAGCKINQKTMAIFAFNTYTNRINLSIMPRSNLSQQLQNATIERRISTVKAPTYMSIEGVSESEITKLEDAIEEQKRNEKLPDGLSTHDIHQYVLTYIILGIIIAAAAFMWIQRRQDIKDTRGEGKREHLEMSTINNQRSKGEKSGEDLDNTRFSF